MTRTSKQLCIVHLSDLHFGQTHRFQAPIAPDGGRAAPTGIPSLLDSLRDDWSEQKSRREPAVVTITGDLTCAAADEEFNKCREFLRQISTKPIMGRNKGLENIFIVPGNHDVAWKEEKAEARLINYCSFYNSLFTSIQQREHVNAEDFGKLTRVFDRSEDLGLLLAEINSSAYVQHGASDAYRGQVDPASIYKLKKELEDLGGSKIKESLKVAILHHHPVLLPGFVEGGRGYDSVINSADLLEVLRSFGFHIILHGHKHSPTAFSYDPASQWKDRASQQPLVILAGGSVGSEELPNHPLATNTYNIITVSWDPEPQQARIHVDTRGLVTHNDGDPLLPQEWHWESLRTLDRLLQSEEIHESPPATLIDFSDHNKSQYESARLAVYAKLRGNMPTVKVVPSLDPTQDYEATVQIIPHETERYSREIPTEVIWSAGPKFRNVAKCKARKNSEFRTSFSYYGPMLIQVQIHFSDGKEILEHVYAHKPQ